MRTTPVAIALSSALLVACATEPEAPTEEAIPSTIPA